MATYIVNTGNKKIVHRNDSIQPECRINFIHPNNMEMTDENYTETRPTVYQPCPHCFGQATNE
ncbi:MAG TPA: hypothetical protein VIG60_10500 [Savagea sp.]